MHADEVLALAQSMRAHALESGDDLNAANLFAHRMLVRALHAERAPARQGQADGDRTDRADAA